MLKAAEFESVIPDLMSDVFVSSARPKITTITLFPCSMHISVCRFCIKKINTRAQWTRKFKKVQAKKTCEMK